ncbi:MAG: methylase [Prevotellaceae bacterium]|nr:methylase [Prevotellaceae bacterium]
MADQRQKAAQDFAKQWKDRGYEKGESQPFWLQLLHDVLGVESPVQYISFEEQVHLDNTSFIDGYIPSTRVMIEQKSLGKNLGAPIKQSDGTLLTPFQQAKRYITEMPVDQHPRYVVTCNFQEFWVYDMNKPGCEPEKILLKDLGREYYRLQFIVDQRSEHLRRELEVSVKAGELVGLIYDAFYHQYQSPGSPDALHSLNVLCVRLVFCLYAEDTDLFGRRDMFHDYLINFPLLKMRKALIELFRTLDTPPEKRDPYLAQEDPLLAAFPYVNGGLFADERIEIPVFTEEIRDLLLKRASLGFDWSEISPTIFGAVFESTLNPETRRSGGMHYTSVENIHKVIDPLFMDQLRRELDEIKSLTVERTRNHRLLEFQRRLSRLTFLDPACGSGNFLTESYLSLRRLENEALQARVGQRQSSFETEDYSPIEVTLAQFHGIEINDFAVTVAKTALWIAESQMMKETETIMQTHLEFFPLKSNTNIVEGNALRLQWQDVVPREKLTYIIGNPPFSGARIMSKEQKQDLNDVFPGWKNVGNLDYVCCWYKRATELIEGTGIRCALVSTNSIAQGEQVATLWKPLMAEGVHIDFAHRTFRWDSEASIKAHVHCVIVGFSHAPNPQPKVIFTDERKHEVQNINGYLLNAANVFIESRNKPLCNVPEIGMGNQPIDDGNYLFSPEEKEEFVKKEPAAARYFKPWYGSYEFINRKPRYCLWLGDCTPAELRHMPECMKRVQAVREFRLASKRASTNRIADKPTRFQTENMPKENYIVIPETSSERRRYAPIGFMSPDVLCSNAIRWMPSANLYHFGILTSNVHMAWMRAVCGRLKSDYRYSKDVVYNNFPWPSPTEEQREKIERTARGILEARDKYPDSSLADLYDEVSMPPELRTAHQQNDRAVMAAYGWSPKDEPYTSESACVAQLMKMYQALTT